MSTLNDVTLPNVTKCIRTAALMGTRIRMGDGSITLGTTRVSPYAYVWSVECEVATTTELSDVQGAFGAGLTADVTFVDPASGSYTVRSIAESWHDEALWVDGEWRFRIAFILEQANPT
jgi:hypothetical protein